jgi:hypothetical protein
MYDSQQEIVTPEKHGDGYEPPPPHTKLNILNDPFHSTTTLAFNQMPPHRKDKKGKAAKEESKPEVKAELKAQYSGLSTKQTSTTDEELLLHIDIIKKPQSVS